MRRNSFRYSVLVIIAIALSATGCQRLPTKKQQPTPSTLTQIIQLQKPVGLDLRHNGENITLYSLTVAQTDTGERFYEKIKIAVPDGVEFGLFVEKIQNQIVPQSYQFVESKVLSDHYPKQVIQIYTFQTHTRVELEFYQKPKAQAVLVIDDLGYNEKAIPYLLEIKRPMTLAVLPYLTYSQKTAKTLHQHGYEVIVHLPMQPESKYANPGPGVVTVDMSDEDIKKCVENALKEVPYAVGINNHMGSLATKDPRVMQAVLSVLKSKKMFFLDSKTGLSVTSDVAAKLGMHVYNRDVFLDNTDEKEYIKGQLSILLNKAQHNGYAIGIGHFRVNTMMAIREMLPEFDTAGIELVFMSRLYEEDPNL
ncbi:MAG: divergent polysaccharide deacetylase family protein [Chlamydiota bacterium]|nr:divergent polysaccharide deacetylase family protein [Chlamydiota bacterium]